MPTRRLQLLGAVPIPQGHRVRVSVPMRPAGLFREARAAAEGEATVLDLDTGITWGRVQTVVGLAHQPGQPLPPGLPAELESAEVFEGTVLRCAVWSQFEKEMGFETVLELELRPQGPPR